MFRKLTLSLILTFSAFLIGNRSFAITYVYDGVTPIPNPLTLNSGDSLYVATGTYTGNINSFSAGAKITISDLAIFQPSTFPNTNGNSARGTMWNYGTFTFNTTFVSNDNFVLHNYGMVTLGNTTLRGSGQTWTNHYGGTINFTNGVLMNGDFGNNNVIINYETINTTGNFQMNSGSAMYNYRDFNVTGNFRVNGGTYDSQGNLIVTGNILMNNGASVIRNYCRMEASAGITNTSGNFYNYSYVRAVNSNITNSANIINARISIGGAPLSEPIIEGVNFTQTGGAMTGPVNLYFTGTTSVTGGAGSVIGVPGVTTDTIKMNDITRTQPTQIFDVQSGTVHPNVIYNVWGVPNPDYVYLFGCSLEILLEIPLAINWNDFTVELFNNIPVLNWSAEFTSGTVFEVQRSYDGRNFSSIKNLAYEVGQKDYEYNDRLVNTHAPFVYYRIKATEIGGVQKYTQIRTVKFTNKPGSIYVVPNPFTSNFIINYKAAEKETITIKMFNVSAQQMLVKNVTVNNGNNIINITEAANLVKGIYIIQVSKGYNIISSSKIIKQ